MKSKFWSGIEKLGLPIDLQFEFCDIQLSPNRDLTDMEKSEKSPICLLIFILGS